MNEYIAAIAGANPKPARKTVLNSIQSVVERPARTVKTSTLTSSSTTVGRPALRLPSRMPPIIEPRALEAITRPDTAFAPPPRARMATSSAQNDETRAKLAIPLSATGPWRSVRPNAVVLRGMWSPRREGDAISQTPPSTMTTAAARSGTDVATAPASRVTSTGPTIQIASWLEVSSANRDCSKGAGTSVG